MLNKLIKKHFICNNVTFSKFSKASKLVCKIIFGIFMRKDIFESRLFYILLPKSVILKIIVWFVILKKILSRKISNQSHNYISSLIFWVQHICIDKIQFITKTSTGGQRLLINFHKGWENFFRFFFREIHIFLLFLKDSSYKILTKFGDIIYNM